MPLCYHSGMRKKQRVATTFRFEEQDREALKAIQEYFGIASASDAVRFALRKLYREIQRESPPPPHQESNQ